MEFHDKRNNNPAVVPFIMKAIYLTGFEFL